MPRRMAAVGLMVLAACAGRPVLRYAPGDVRESARGGLVAAEEAIAVAIGERVLAEGGNAADAAVATAFALAVTLPQAGPLGGGGFAVVRVGGTTDALDFREVAPAAATRDMFLGEDGKPVTGRSLWTRLGAGVPGNPAGLAALHARHGRMPWARLVDPAVRLARDGFPVSARLARELNEHRKRFLADSPAAAIFVRPDRPWRAGDRLVQTDLAKTLARVRARGADGFYRGGTGVRLAADMAARGGLVTAADLAAYRPEWRAPARFSFRGYEIVTMPLPSSGGIVLPQILGILDAAPPAPRLHLFAEAERRAFADRNSLLGDPAVVPADEVARLTSPDYLAARAATIDPERATPSKDIGPGLAEPTETTNLSVVDRFGNAVAMTITLNATFGSHLVAAGTGVLLNNEMDDFAAKPGIPNQFGLRQGARNAVVPGRRPLSSMSPTLALEDGEVVLALGSPGGPRILTSVALVLLRRLGDGMALPDAVLAARIHHQHLPDEIRYEDARLCDAEGTPRPDLEIGAAALAGLRERGHALVPYGTGIGRVTAIARDPATGRLTAVVDPRAR